MTWSFEFQTSLNRMVQTKVVLFNLEYKLDDNALNYTLE